MNDGTAAVARHEALDRPLPAWASITVRAGLCILLAVLGFAFARFVSIAATRSSGGFVAYYTAAQLVRQGAPVSRFYDDEWFRAAVERYDPVTGDIYNVNPPTTALMLLPFAGLEYRAARVAWTVVNLLIVALAIGWTAWRLDFRAAWLAAVIVFALADQPLRANFWHGQAYVLLLGLAVLAWEGYRSRRAGLLGISLGVMILVKTAGIWFIPLLVAERRWQALGWAIASMTCIVLASLPWLGIDAWRTYLALLPGLIGAPQMSVTAYQTQWSFARHLFLFDAELNPAPILDAPALAFGSMAVLALALVGIAMYTAIRRAPGEDRTFALFTAIGLILSPVSVDYHYTLLLLPIVIAIDHVRREPLSWRWFALLFAIGLVAADLPYRSPALSAGAAALLAYPKLYGAWLLSAVVIAGGRRPA